MVLLLTDKLTFQRERLDDCAEEAMPLLETHWREIAHYQDIPLDPDWSKYEAIEAKDGLRIFTVRDDGTLKGYAVFMVGPNMHYQSSVQAVQDILWLSPDLRGHMLGARFIDWCDEELRKDGVQAVYQHVKMEHDFGPLLKRLGYEPIDMVWGRRLDRGH